MAEVKLENIKGNSFKEKEASKNPKKEVKPVAKKSDLVKKSLGEKFKETFLQEDVADVKSWLVEDILIPGIKNTILDGLGMMFFKEGRGYSRRHRESGYDRERVSYNSYYGSDRYSGRRDRDDYDDRHKEKIDYRNIILKPSAKDKAEDVVDEMHHRIDDFGQVSIAEMLDMMEITGSYVDNNWGWTRKGDIGLRRVSSGWLIDVAEAKPLDN